MVFLCKRYPRTPVFKKHFYATYYFPSWKQLVYAGSKRKLKQFRLIVITAVVLFEHKLLEGEDSMDTWVMLTGDPEGRDHAISIRQYSQALAQCLYYVWNSIIIY